MNKLQKPWIFFPVIGLAILGVFLLIKLRNPVEHNAASMTKRKVEVYVARELPFRARALAYGNVEPAIVIQSKSEVKGKITWTHPGLKQGGTISAGKVVVRIEATDYAATLKQSQADLEADISNLRQLEAEEKSTRRSLSLAKNNLKVGRKELRRKQKLWKQRLIARSVLDTEQQKVIQLEQSVQTLQGQLDTFKSRKQAIQARIKRSTERVKSQQTTLGRTEIRLPFDARIGKVYAQKNEFVNIGSPLFDALNIDGIEINAQLPILYMRNLVANIDPKKLNFAAHGDFGKVLKAMNLEARVRLVGNFAQARWRGRVVRFSESIDPTRRTLGVVVAVDQPYKKAIPGKRPPLLKGMYTAVELITPERTAIIIPRRALHQGRVFIANSENRLEIRQVKTRFSQNDMVVVNAGVKPGERVIITDLVPVIEGMPLDVEINREFQQQFRERARGADAP